MRYSRIAASSVLVLGLTGIANAQEPERYRLEKTDNGYVRMDTKTGAMSLCEERSGQLVCKLAADERVAMQDEIERLQSSLKSVEERVTKLEGSLPARIDSALPTEEDFEKSLGYMERFFRRFMGIAKDMEKEDQNPPPAAPAPDKT
jgi:flagellar motility protein MotE (MotC chaperone)